MLADPDWAEKVRTGRMDQRIPFGKDLLAQLY